MSAKMFLAVADFLKQNNYEYVGENVDIDVAVHERVWRVCLWFCGVVSGEL